MYLRLSFSFACLSPGQSMLGLSVNGNKKKQECSDRKLFSTDNKVQLNKFMHENLTLLSKHTFFSNFFFLPFHSMLRFIFTFFSLFICRPNKRKENRRKYFIEGKLNMHQVDTLSMNAKMFREPKVISPSMASSTRFVIIRDKQPKKNEEKT